MTGEQVRRLRLQLGLTQDELAGRLGVARNSVARWEREEHGLSGPAEKLLTLLAELAATKGRHRGAAPERRDWRSKPRIRRRRHEQGEGETGHRNGEDGRGGNPAS